MHLFPFLRLQSLPKRPVERIAISKCKQCLTRKTATAHDLPMVAKSASTLEVPVQILDSLLQVQCFQGLSDHRVDDVSSSVSDKKGEMLHIIELIRKTSTG